jgi:RNA polymerase sigma-70 factor (ECF subfamily)
MPIPPDLDARFAALVMEHQAGVRAFIRMLGVEAGSVDDIAQETFIVALRRLEDYDQTLPAGPWLRGIARNLVLNHRRSLARHALVVHPALAEVLEMAVGTSEDPAGKLHLDELVSHLRDCIERLPARGRALIAARYTGCEREIGGVATAATADNGPNANARRQALFRVRETLRRCLVAKVGEVEL